MNVIILIICFISLINSRNLTTKVNKKKISTITLNDNEIEKMIKKKSRKIIWK